MCDRTGGLCVCVRQSRQFEPSTSVSRKEGLLCNQQETVNLHINSCVVSPVHFAKGYPQKKGVNPVNCHYTEIKHVKDVSCVDHLSSVNLVTNIPTFATDLPEGARLHLFWEKWAVVGASPKVVTILREGYTLPFWFRSNLTRSPTVISCYVKSQQEPLLVGGIASAFEQKCSGTGSKSEMSRTISSTQIQPPVETHLEPEHLEHLPKHRVVQNGDTRDNKNLATGRGVGYLHRFQRCILPCTNTQPVQEVHAFSRSRAVLPVQGTTLWSVHSTHGVHSSGQRGQIDGFTVVSGPSPTILVPTYTDLGGSLSRTRLAGEQGEIRTGTKTGFQLCRLPVRLARGQGQTHIQTGTLAKSSNKHSYFLNL